MSPSIRYCIYGDVYNISGYFVFYDYIGPTTLYGLFSKIVALLLVSARCPLQWTISKWHVMQSVFNTQHFSMLLAYGCQLLRFNIVGSKLQLWALMS